MCVHVDDGGLIVLSLGYKVSNNTFIFFLDFKVLLFSISGLIFLKLLYILCFVSF